jgi:hypothetical protein
VRSNIETVIRELPVDLAALEKPPAVAHCYSGWDWTALCGYKPPMKGTNLKPYSGKVPRCVVCEELAGI